MNSVFLQKNRQLNILVERLVRIQIHSLVNSSLLILILSLNISTSGYTCYANASFGRV